MLSTVLFMAMVSFTDPQTGELVTGEITKALDEETCVMEVESEMRSIERDFAEKGYEVEITGICRRVK